MDCICQEPLLTTESSLLDTFTTVRERCPAIRELFLPDAIWPNFCGWHRTSGDEANHKSILLLAMARNQLSSVTTPVHRYLFESDRLKSCVRRQYIKDLREQWMYLNDAMERHQKFRTFFGRLVELQAAAWLEGQGWKISSLEAYREGPDIEATDDNQKPTAFEVKYIGQDNQGFDTVLKSLGGEPVCEMRSPYAAVNYLLYRVYEAAKQLQRWQAAVRIALVVIDEVTWFTFETQLNSGWIDWKDPAFQHVADPFIDKQRSENQDLDNDLKSMLRGIDAVWILKRSYGNQYVRMFDISL